MKKAIGYIRISTKHQSNFSLEGQEQLIWDYCEKQSIDLVAFFKDEGQSAKNFDRVNWKLLAEFVAKNHSRVDYLVVSKYDRFSRNVSEALQMIEKLEKQYHIRIKSEMENISLHPASPYFFQFRTQMLIGALVELMVMKDRTGYGIHTANKSGRWVNNAPAGYTWIKGDKKTKTQGYLVINEETAPFVKGVFQYFIMGMPVNDIRRQLIGFGLRIRGNSAIHEL